MVSGVPQGNLLGSLCTLHNYLFDTIEVAKPFTHADDMKLFMVTVKFLRIASTPPSVCI